MENHDGGFYCLGMVKKSGPNWLRIRVLTEHHTWHQARRVCHNPLAALRALLLSLVNLSITRIPCTSAWPASQPHEAACFFGGKQFVQRCEQR